MIFVFFGAFLGVGYAKIGVWSDFCRVLRVFGGLFLDSEGDL